MIIKATHKFLKHCLKILPIVILQGSKKAINALWNTILPIQFHTKMDFLSCKQFFFTIGQIYSVLSSSNRYHAVKSYSNPCVCKQNKLNNILMP